MDEPFAVLVKKGETPDRRRIELDHRGNLLSSVPDPILAEASRPFEQVNRMIKRRRRPKRRRR